MATFNFSITPFFNKFYILAKNTIFKQGVLMMAVFAYALIFLAIAIVLSSIRIINQYEQGVVFTLGKFTGIRSPGLNFVVPILQRMVVVDMRVRTIDIEKQQVMTKDNVPVNVNGVV